MLTPELQERKRFLEKQLGISKNPENPIGKHAAMAARSIAATPGYLADLINLPGSLIQKGINKVVGLPDDEDYSYGESTKKIIDKATKNYTKPETKNEKLAESAFDVLTPGPGGKIKAVSKIAKLAKKAATKIPHLAGNVGAQHIENENPEDYLTPTALRVGSGFVSPSLKKLKSISDNAKLARIKKNPELKNKILQEIERDSGARQFHKVGNKEVGELAQKAAHNYIEKKGRVFEKAFERPAKQLEFHTEGMTNENRYVSTKDAVDFGLGKYQTLESNVVKKEFLKSETGKKLQLLLDIHPTTDVKKFETSLINKGRHPSLPIRDAESIRRGIGEETSKFGVLGNEQKGNLETMSGLLEESLGNKYLEVSPKALKQWKFAKKHYGSHKNKNEPIVNEILKEKHKPVESFRTATKDLSKDATSTKFVSNYLKGTDKYTFHKGLISELGDKGGKFDILTFNKKLNELPAQTKKMVLKGLEKNQLKDLGSGLKRTKTLEEIEKKKGLTDFFKHFVPHKWEKAINPISALRQYKPDDVKKTYNLLKKKAHTPYQKAEKYSLHPTLLKGSSSENKGRLAPEEKSNLTPELQERKRFLEKELGINKKPYMEGGHVSSDSESDAYHSDAGDEDAKINLRTHIMTDNFKNHHLMLDRGKNMSKEATQKSLQRIRNRTAAKNDVFAITKKWQNKLIREFGDPNFQHDLKTRGYATIAHPIKAAVYKTSSRGFPNAPSFTSGYQPRRKIKLTVSTDRRKDGNGDLIINHLEGYETD